MREKIEIFSPLTLAFYPLVSLYSSNLDEVTVRAVLNPAGVVFALTALVYWVVRWRRMSQHKAAILTGFSVMFVCSYGTAQIALNSIVELTNPHLLLMPILGLGLIATTILVRRMRLNIGVDSRLLLLGSLGLFLVQG